MILPEPEENLNRNPMVIGADILKHLQRSQKDYEIVEKLMKKTLSERPESSPKDFMTALIFLYTTGLIDVEGFQIKLSELARRDSQRRGLEEFT